MTKLFAAMLLALAATVRAEDATTQPAEGEAVGPALDTSGDLVEAASTSGEKNNATKCYVCNSISDEGCGEDFDAKIAEKYIKDCENERPAHFTGGLANIPVGGCRKIVQELPDDQDSVVRTCAFLGNKDDPAKRTGGKDVKAFVHMCTDHDYCNASHGLSFSLALLLAAVIAALL